MRNAAFHIFKVSFVISILVLGAIAVAWAVPPGPPPDPDVISVPVMEGWWTLPGVLAAVGMFGRRRKG